jgi:hypothetical protein
LPQSASCSENFAIPPDVSGQTLSGKGNVYIEGASASQEAALVFTGGASAFTSNSGTFELSYAAPLTLNTAFTNSGSLDVYNDSNLTIGGNFTNSGSNSSVDIEYGSTVTINGTFSNSGYLYVDDYGSGGSSLTFQGPLTNSGFVYFGNPSTSASETFTLAGLTNSSGAIFEVRGSTSHEATLDFTSGASAFTSNAGTFELSNVTPLTLNTAFSNSGTIDLTNTNLTIGGALTNTGTISDDDGTLTLDTLKWTPDLGPGA